MKLFEKSTALIYGNTNRVKLYSIRSCDIAIMYVLSTQWAFGVTCWEVFTLGGTPYAALDFEDMLLFLEQGSRLRKPQLCSQNV